MSGGSVSSGKTRSITQQRQRTAWVFLAPLLLVMLLVTGWPLLSTLGLSFTNASLNPYTDIFIGDGQRTSFDLRYPVTTPDAIEVRQVIGRDDASILSPPAFQVSEDVLTLATPLADKTQLYVTFLPEFVGFENYAFLLQDPVWWASVKNTFFFASVSVALETILGLAIALMMHASFKGRGLLRAAILVPWAIPTIVSAKMWGWMYHDIYGVINAALLSLGLIDQSLAWTADPDLALWSVILVDVWKTTPFMAILLLAALQLLPNECYEAAKIDGIHPVRVFFKVTLPLIWPALMVALVFRLLDAMRVFDLIFILTSNSRDTMSMSVYVRQQMIDFADLGFGSAAATMLFALVAVLTVTVLKVGKVKMD